MMCVISQLLQPVSKEFIADVEMQYFPHSSPYGLFRLCTLVSYTTVVFWFWI